MPINGTYSTPPTQANSYSTVDDLLGLLYDNTSNAIDARDVRDSVYTLWDKIDNIHVAGNGVTASGTVNYLAKFNDLNILGNSTITDDGSTVTINGDLMVLGTTSTIDTLNLIVQDPIFLLAGTQSGTPLLDSGFFIDRGTGMTAGIIWDESEDEFSFIQTNDPATIYGDVNINNYSNIRGASASLTGLYLYPAHGDRQAAQVSWQDPVLPPARHGRTHQHPIRLQVQHHPIAHTRHRRNFAAKTHPLSIKSGLVERCGGSLDGLRPLPQADDSNLRLAPFAARTGNDRQSASVRRKALNLHFRPRAHRRVSISEVNAAGGVLQEAQVPVMESQNALKTHRIALCRLFPAQLAHLSHDSQHRQSRHLRSVPHAFG